MKKNYRLEYHDTISQECEKILFHEISDDAFHAKGLPPIRQFSVILKDEKQKIVGGATGVTIYGSLYVDMLWVEKSLRGHGWGAKIMQGAEKIGRERGVSFVTLNTMDWEALPFYQKLGYSIEFIREGYEKDSKMFMLRKNLLT
jgi:ribosomal protein S18 acetylase RimI-like enzyme